MPLARLIARCLIAAGLIGATAISAPAADKPNVLFIAIDDLNDWIGCLGGHPQALTPNLDRLAERGILFTNAHCAAPACNPSRAAVFSGQMPWKTGVWSNRSRKLMQERPEHVVLPKAFERSGYLTLGTGKLMHSGEKANRGFFERSFGVEQRWSPFTKEQVQYTKAELPSKGSDSPRHVVELQDGSEVVLPLNGMRSDRKPETNDGESFDWGPVDVPDSSMGDTQITDWAIGQLQSGMDEKPFFLGVGFYRPHIPLFAPARFFKRFADQTVKLPDVLDDDLNDLGDEARRWAIEAITAGLHSTVVENQQWKEAIKGYLACTTFVDLQVGRLVDALDQGRFGSNTVIVVWSDHGWHLGEKQHWGKWTGWERSTRVPLIIVPPRRNASDFASVGTRCDVPVSLIDLYPTLMELCGVETPVELDGTSLVPLLRDPESDSSRVIATVFDPGNVSLRSASHRYVRYAGGSEELYDLRSDPNEWTNLIGTEDTKGLIQEFRDAVPASALSADD